MATTPKKREARAWKRERDWANEWEDLYNPWEELAIDSNVADCCATYAINGFPFDSDQIENHGKAAEELVRRLEVIEDIARKENKSILVATVNTEQKCSARALKEAGWQGTTWAERIRPTETKVKLFYKLINKKAK